MDLKTSSTLSKTSQRVISAFNVSTPSWWLKTYPKKLYQRTTTCFTKSLPSISREDNTTTLLVTLSTVSDKPSLDREQDLPDLTRTTSTAPCSELTPTYTLILSKKERWPRVWLPTASLEFSELSWSLLINSPTRSLTL
jgi:hypothetical protein